MGPYVPAAWRTGREGMVELPMLAPFAEPTAIAEFMEVAEQAEMSGLEPSAAAQPVAAPNDSLPWINAFLAATPVEPLAAIPASNDAVVAQVPEATPAADEIRALSDAIDSRDALPTTPTATASTDEWPLEEAASELDELAHQLESLRPPPPPAEPEASFVDSQAPSPLPPWSDEDMVDIMPLARPLHMPGSQATSTGVHAPDRDQAAEAAAHALELLARRVRAGEIELPGYEPRMGDAAALVSALAALLGVRLG